MSLFDLAWQCYYAVLLPELSFVDSVVRPCDAMFGVLVFECLEPCYL